MRNMTTENKVLIFDTTLRDGEQAPGASMNKDEKLEIAFVLERLGVDIIEAGFPIASKGDFESVQNVARHIKNSTICGLARPKEGYRCRGRRQIRKEPYPCFPGDVKPSGV